MNSQKNTEITLFQSNVVERAVLYARVSSDDRSKDGRNLASQLEMGREYAVTKGYVVIDELAEDDRGASGAEIDLPQLNKVREQAHAGAFDVLIVRELDRLSRNLAKQLIVEEELKRCQVRVEYVLADYDDTPEGRLQKHIRATVAEYEREKSRERMVRGKRNKAKAGHTNVSQQPPFGYKLVDNGTICQLEIEPTEAEVIKYIYEQFLNGSTIEAIRARLTEKGIPTPSDLRRFWGAVKKGDWGRWNRSTIHRILSSPVYAGTWHFGKSKSKKYRKKDGKTGYRVVRNPRSHWIEVKVPAIINQEFFDLAQQRLAENKKRCGRKARGEFLLSKRCTCGECGYKLGTSNAKTSYYFCMARHRPDLVRECSQKAFRQDKVDAAVWNWIELILYDEQRLAEELDNIDSARNRHGVLLQSQLEAAEAKIAELDEELSEAVEVLKDLKKGGRAYAAVLTDIDRLEDTIAKLDTQRNILNKQLNQTTLSQDKVNRLKEFAIKVRDGLELARQDFTLRKAIIELLDVEVKLIREGEDEIAYITCFLSDTTELKLSTTLHSHNKQWFEWKIAYGKLG